MVERNTTLIEYLDKIRNINLDQIEVNEFNPRKRFIESEEDELIESILSKGILNPIIVYKKNGGKYVILDGERRYRASVKLNLKTIPAHILVREPTKVENISMMFHIHNVREEWTDFAISLSLKRVVEEMGKDIQKLKSQDIKELKRITSLSEYKLRKYLKFHDYPAKVIERFMDSEKKEKPDRGVDPDILAEMHKPIKEIKSQMPELLKKYPVPKIINACIRKKAEKTIETNKEFRLLSKAFAASKRGEIRKEVLKDKIIEFIEKPEVTPQKIYSDTSEAVYQIKEIIKDSNKLYSQIANLNLNRITDTERKNVKKNLEKLARLISEKILENE